MCNFESYNTVTRWQCDDCGKRATKFKNRWMIWHRLGCPLSAEPEDVGPVTSVNDPDNAYYVADD